jgi:galactitol-specific phosphotransferase system IIB component
MKILCVCEQGNNRSVTFAHLLRYKYLNSEVIPMGMLSLQHETKKMLYRWADIIIVTDKKLMDSSLLAHFKDKVKLWDVGADNYNRPFNVRLYQKAKYLINQNPL